MATIGPTRAEERQSIRADGKWPNKNFALPPAVRSGAEAPRWPVARYTFISDYLRVLLSVREVRNR